LLRYDSPVSYLNGRIPARDLSVLEIEAGHCDACCVAGQCGDTVLDRSYAVFDLGSNMAFKTRRNAREITDDVGIHGKP
jgi:hypothetical protein